MSWKCGTGCMASIFQIFSSDPQNKRRQRILSTGSNNSWMTWRPLKESKGILMGECPAAASEGLLPCVAD